MAAVAGPTHTCMIVDMILEKQPLGKILLQFRPHLFCTTGYITHMPVIKGYCWLAKQLLPGVHTVVGGVHTEKFPEDTDHPAIDFRVVRNATRSFPLLLHHIEQGAPLPAGVLAQGQVLKPENLPAFDFYFPKPLRDLTAKYRKKYFYVFHSKVALLKTSFGCPYTCNFCFCRQITDGHYHARPLDEVIEELKEIKEKEVYIVDDDFLLSPTRLTEFIKRVKEENIRKRYLVYGRADFIASHPDLIGQLHEIGLRTVIVGIESFSDSELQSFEKRTSQAINEQALKILHDHGVECYGAVITSPEWTEEDFRRTGDKLLALGLRFVNLQPLTPLKGTGVQVSDADLVIARNDFPKWDLAHVAIRPKHMSLYRYYKNLLRLYERILFSPGNMLHHALHEPPGIQWKLARGLVRVYRQYLERIKDAKQSDAQNTLHTGYTV
jgi:radical SAM superfamily enzyme YgiQ (UPF0313 family)